MLPNDFLKNVKKTETCWLWVGHVDKKGYGRFAKNSLAHRYSFQLWNGAIPDGLCVCHFCDNPPCVNPKHLWLGTRADNIRDMWSKGRGAHLKGEKNGSSKLVAKNIPEIFNLKIQGLTQTQISRIYGVHQTQIGRVLMGSDWRVGA